MAEPVWAPRKLVRPGSPLAWIGGPWLNRERIQWAFDRQRQDRFGLRVHLFGAIVLCLSQSFPNAVHEVLLPIVASASVIRITMTWRLLFHLVIQPAVLVAMAWLVYRAISTQWSPDEAKGWDHLAELRFMLLILALWPVMEYRAVLILSYLAGMFLGNLLQLGEGVAVVTGWNWLVWQPHPPGRISGWWGPAWAGASLCVPLAIWLHAGLLAREARSRWRRLSLAMSAVTLVALIATGTRSAWLTAAAVVAIVLAVWGWRMFRERTARSLKGPAIAGVLVVLAMIPLAGLVAQRGTAGVREVSRALGESDFDSDTGARLLMWVQAGRAFAERPITGIGEGGYRRWARVDARERGIERPAVRRIQEQAHGTVPHIAATSGLIGLALWGLLVACAMHAAWTRPRDGPTGLERSLLLALLAIVIVGQFETMHLGSRLKQHFWLLVALSPAMVPVQRILASPDDRSAGYQSE